MVFLGLQVYLKGVSRLSQGSFKDDSRVFLSYIMGVSKLNATWKSYWICTGCGTCVFAIFWQGKSISNFGSGSSSTNTEQTRLITLRSQPIVLRLLGVA